MKKMHKREKQRNNRNRKFNMQTCKEFEVAFISHCMDSDNIAETETGLLSNRLTDTGAGQNIPQTRKTKLTDAGE